MKATLYFLGSASWMVVCTVLLFIAAVLLFIAAGLLAIEDAIENAPVVPNEPEGRSNSEN